MKSNQSQILSPVLVALLPILAVFVGIGSPNSSWGFGCNTENIIISSNDSITTRISRDGFKTAGGSRFRVKIPVTVGKEIGCFVEKSDFSFKAYRSNSADRGSISIKTPTATFRNLPQPRVDTYVHIENSTSSPWENKVTLLSFICAGEIPLSLQSYEESFHDVQDYATAAPTGNEVRMVFATGAAAVGSASHIAAQAALNTGDRNRKSTLGTLNRFVPEFFQNEFLKQGNLTEGKLSEVIGQIPSYQIGISSGSPFHNRAIGMTSVMVNQAGCSSKFREIMAPYLISNLPSKIGNLTINRARDNSQFTITWGH